MIQLDEIKDKVLAYNPQARVDIIEKAYNYSSKAHEGQKRKSGEPYLVHPIEVADILAEMKLDVSSVVAGILHDTVEDTDVTQEDIQEIFGEEIATLVDGVTKLSKLQFNNREERQAENFRKMILAMSQDIRVILIKLADRLNNMKTLQFMPEEKQMTISKETADIYAPLANRLGIQWLKVELEDLSFRFLKPDVYKQIDKKMSRLKHNREDYIERVEKKIEEHFRDSVHGYEISGRMKHAYSIFRKMERQNISFEQVHDLIAFRILTDNVEECYEVLGLLHSLWKPVPGRFKDYIAMPKENNYQSLHTTVICVDGERVEFQIRTFEMHEIAEKGIAAHWKYKNDGRLDVSSEQTYAWLRNIMEWKESLYDSIEFMDTIKQDLFSSEIYVFTPQGDVRALPFGATPIDFAYSIHSDVGNHCAGARVNEKMVSLNYQLQSGDVVEIQTHDKKFPTKDWLNMVVSSRARAHIRSHLKSEQRAKSIKIGESIFDEECRKRGLKYERVIKKEDFQDILRKRGLPNLEGFYSAVAYGKISIEKVLTQLFPQTSAEPQKRGQILRKIFSKVSKQSKNLVKVGGVDDLLVTFGKCCSPISGDSIVGFVTRGRGVTVHRVDCSKVCDTDPGRRVTVTWNKDIEERRLTRIRILSENRTGILADITRVVADKKIDIRSAVTRTTKDEKAIILISLMLQNVRELYKVMKGLEKIKSVISVDREGEAKKRKMV